MLLIAVDAQCTPTADDTIGTNFSREVAVLKTAIVNSVYNVNGCEDAKAKAEVWLGSLLPAGAAVGSDILAVR